MAEDIKTAVKIFKARIKDMGDEEVKREYEKLVKKFGKRNVDKELGLEQKLSKKSAFTELRSKLSRYLKKLESLSTLCPQCLGSGVFQGLVCSKCKGTGVISESKVQTIALREQLSIKEVEEIQQGLEEVVELLSRVSVPVTVYEDAMKKLSALIKKSEQYRFPFEFIRDLKDYYKQIVGFAEQAVELSTSIDDWISDFEDFLEKSFKK